MFWGRVGYIVYAIYIWLYGHVAVIGKFYFFMRLQDPWGEVL